MITLLNRKELVILFSQRRLHAVQLALDAAGIGYRAKFAVPLGRVGGRARAIPFQDPDTAHDYKVYVHRNDYDRAMAAIQPALRDA